MAVAQARSTLPLDDGCQAKLLAQAFVRWARQSLRENIGDVVGGTNEQCGDRPIGNEIPG